MAVYMMMALSFLPVAALLTLFCLVVPGFRVRYGLWATVTGLLALIPIATIHLLLSYLPPFLGHPLLEALITVMVFNGLVEETIKMLSMLLLPHKKATPPAFLAMSMLSGLSLGCFETVIYLFAGYHDIGLRIATAVAMHSLCAGLSGIFLWMWRSTDKVQAPTRRLTPFLLAVLLHGAYNFFAGLGGAFRWFSVIAILLAALECRIWFQRGMGPDSR